MVHFLFYFNSVRWNWMFNCAHLLYLCHHPWRHDACYASLLWIWFILWTHDRFEHEKWKI